MDHTNLSRSTNLLHFLEAHGLLAKRSLSQNFLIDAHIVSKIVALANVAQDDFVVEIGPGPGALTEEIASKTSHLLLLEKDREFAKLAARFKTARIVEGDALDFPFESLKNAKLISNLPYNITKPLLERLLPQTDSLLSLTLMMQTEVFDKLRASPGSKMYGPLTLLCQFYADLIDSFSVSRNCFFPKPNVDSTVVHLALKQPPSVDPKPFFLFVHTAFAQRRKMLRASCKKLYPHITSTQRPEELSLPDFIRLFSFLENKS